MILAVSDASYPHGTNNGISEAVPLTILSPAYDLHMMNKESLPDAETTLRYDPFARSLRSCPHMALSPAEDKAD